MKIDETLEKHLQNKIDTVWTNLVSVAESLKLRKEDEPLDEFNLTDYKEQIEKAIYEVEEIALMVLPNRERFYK